MNKTRFTISEKKDTNNIVINFNTYNSDKKLIKDISIREFKDYTILYNYLDSKSNSFKLKINDTPLNNLENDSAYNITAIFAIDLIKEVITCNFVTKKLESDIIITPTKKEYDLQKNTSAYRFSITSKKASKEEIEEACILRLLDLEESFNNRTILFKEPCITWHLDKFESELKAHCTCTTNPIDNTLKYGFTWFCPRT